MSVSLFMFRGDAQHVSFIGLSVPLAVVLVAGALAPSFATAQNETIVSIQSQEAESGTAVDVPVEVTGFSQVGSVSLIINYDPGALSFPNEAETDDLISNAVRGDFAANVPEPGQLRISWFDATGSSPINVGEGTLLEMTFSEFVGDEAELTFDPESEIANSNGIPVDATLEGGTVALDLNFPPDSRVEVPDKVLKIPGPSLQLIDVAQTVFQDPDDDELTISAASDNSLVATTEVDDAGNVTIVPEGTGTAEINLTASDGEKEDTLSFLVTVEDRAAGAPEPSARAAATLDSAANGQVLDFKGTGVKVVPAAVEGTGGVGVALFDSGPNGTDGISEANVSQYRAVITATEELEVGANTEVRFPVSDFSGIDDPAQVIIYSRSSPGGGSFTLLPTSVDENGTPQERSDDEILGTTGTLGEFALASNTEPLPVELVRFAARLDGAAATLRWETASETNNAGFSVEHRGPDQQDFAELGFVESKATSGTTEETETYRFRAEELAPGTHRFRLRQVDLDGSEVLLETTSLEVEASRELSLEGDGSNPVRQSARFAFSVRQDGQVAVVLYNALGQQVRTLYTKAARAGQRYTVDVPTTDLSSGAYFVTLEAPSGTQTERFEVVR